MAENNYSSTDNLTAKTQKIRSYCVQCRCYLAETAVPVTVDVKCSRCGAVNAYEESQQPTRLKTVV